MHQHATYRPHKHPRFSQRIMLGLDGFIIHSCDSIFSTQPLQGAPVTQNFPLLESIFDTLIQLEPNSPEIRLSKAAGPAQLLPGYYDYTFLKLALEGGQECILWSIYDYTPLYQALQQYQQLKHELEIYRQKLEKHNRQIQQPADIQKLHRTTQEQFPSSGFTLYTAFQQALQSPANILDTLSSPSIKNAQLPFQEQLNSLRATVEQFQHIIREFEGSLNTRGSSTFSPIQAIGGLAEGFNQQSSHAPLKYQITDGMPKVLAGTPTALEQILQHLLSVLDQKDSQIELNAELIHSNLHHYLMQLTVTHHIDHEKEHVPLSPAEQTQSILRLSFIRKLAEWQGGYISLQDNPSNDSTIIICQLPYSIPQHIQTS